VPTQHVQDNGEAPRTHVASRPRIHRFTAAPIFDTAVTA